MLSQPTVNTLEHLAYDRHIARIYPHRGTRFFGGITRTWTLETQVSVQNPRAQSEQRTRTAHSHTRHQNTFRYIMLFHFLFLILALALTSAAFPTPSVTDLPAHGNATELQWAAASMPLLGDSSALGLNEKAGQSLSDVWDLPPGLLFCNESSDIPINHNYVTSLINTFYAGRANSALLRADSGWLWKIAHKIGTLPGTQICKSLLPLLGVLRRSFPDE